jgi:hypothetical protein
VTTVQTSSAAATNGGPATERKTLVFFVGTDTGIDPGPLHTAQHFASVAAGAGLAAEVRLAARAARNLGAVAVPPPGVSITVCPRAMAKYGIDDDQVAAIGARPRPLAEILTDVAEGRAVLIPVTHSIDDPKAA